MNEELLNFVKNCSKDSKLRISDFLTQLMNNDTNDTSTQQSQSSCQQYTKLQQIFSKISHKFTIEHSRQISKDQRNKKMLTNHQYNYGQIVKIHYMEKQTFRTIYKIMKKLRGLRKMTEEEVFYDLGSGSGKVIFGAGLCYPFMKCKGIEFLQSLYSESLKLKSKIISQKQLIEDTVNQCTQQFEEYHLPLIQFSNSDFKTSDWSDATVVFVSSTCYSRQVMNEISHMSQKLAKHTILITLTKSLDNDSWKLIDKFEGETSWGACTIYIHRKETDWDDKQGTKESK